MCEQFNVRTVAPNFVAEITGVRLDRPLAEVSVAHIAKVWAEHPVVVFPDQPLDHVGLAAFARQLGDFGYDPYIRPVPGHEHVIEVRREPGETTPIFGASWHSDWSFQATPPSATVLHAKMVPPIGGDTLFADCYHAYETLSPAIKETLNGLQAIHCAAPAYGPRGLFAKDDASRSMQIVVSPDAESAQVHPMVRTHPVSGRPSLFINPVYTVGIEGMDQRESRSLLRILLDHMTQDDFTYRHKWRPHMLVLWDNRCVIHYAEGGYAGYQRVMHRITLAGERPVWQNQTRSQ